MPIMIKGMKQMGLTRKCDRMISYHAGVSFCMPVSVLVHCTRALALLGSRDIVRKIVAGHS